MFKRAKLRLLTLLALVGVGWMPLQLFAQSNCFEVEGVAVIENGDVAFARQLAVRDALAQAVLSSQVRVNAQSETVNHTLSRQTAQFAAQQRVTSMKRLGEVQEEGMIKVTVSACLAEEAKSCPNYIARYTPKVAIASVAVQDEYSVKDIIDIAPGYQGELFNRLWSSGQRNVEIVGIANDLYAGRPIIPNLSPTLLQSLSDRTLAQYVVLTVIRSADWETEQSGLAKEIRQTFRFDKEPTQRTVNVDWFVIDLIQQRMLVQGNAFKKVSDSDVRVGRDKPFASRQFFVTPTGQLFDYVLAEQVASIKESLACTPIAATIAEVTGDQIVVPISIDAGVAQGDVLAVYSKTSRPYRIGAIELGTDFEPTAFIRVTKVLPKFIVGKFEGKKGLVQAGDIVKSW